MDAMPSYKLRKVEGKVLTIVDAAISDKQQCEAVKSLIRQEIGELYSWTTDYPPVSSSTYKYRADGSTSTGPKTVDNTDIKIIS